MFPVSPAGAVEVPTIQSVALGKAVLAYAEARLQPGVEPLITTAAQQWSYAVSLPLGVDPAGGADLAVEARLRVLQGKVGVGVLAADEKSFLVEKSVTANGGQSASVVLRLPCPPVIGPLIVRNVSEKGLSQAVLEQVAIRRLPPLEAGEKSAAWSEPTRDELPALVRSLEYLRPLVPYPGWQFDSDWNNPDFSFQTRRRLWEYCLSRHWDIVVELPWYGGQRIELPLLSDAGRQLFVGGCIDPNEFAFLDAILDPEMVFVDVGAHLGLYTLFAARRAAAVWAFEPSSREFARLESNLRRGGLSGVQVLRRAVGNADKTAQLQIAHAMHSGQNTLHAFSHSGVVSESVETVEVERLDRFAREHELRRLDVLKVDAEQSELEVLEGAREILGSLQPWVLVEMNPAPDAGPRNREVSAFLGGLGYRFYQFDRGNGRLIEAHGGDAGANLVARPARRSLPDGGQTLRRYYFGNGAGKSKS